MAIIYTYKTKALPSLTDLLIISDTADKKKTKKITISSIKEVIDVVDKITATSPLAVDKATGDINISIADVIPTTLGGTGLTTIGTANQLLAVNADASGLTYIDPTSGGGSISIKEYDVQKIAEATSLNFKSGLSVGVNGTQADLNAVYNTSLGTDTEMASTIGGFDAGTKVSGIKDMNLVQMWDTLLFPTVLPQYKPATLVLSSTVTGIKEIGSTVNPTLTLLGTKKDAGAFTRLKILRGSTQLIQTTSPTVATITELPQQFGFDNDNNPNKTYSTSYVDSSYIIPAPTGDATSTTTTYSGEGDYGAGLALKNNKGVYDTRTPAVGSSSAPQAAQNNKSSNNRTITGYYPYFYGKSSSQLTTQQIKDLIIAGDSSVNKVIANSSGSLSMNFNADGEWCWFLTYNKFSNKTAWYATALNNGTIGQQSDDLFPLPTNFTIKSKDNLWEVDYKIYIATKVTTITNATIS